MMKSLHLSHFSRANPSFPCYNTNTFYSLFSIHLYVQGFPRQKHVYMCQALVWCTSSEDSVSWMYHTPSSFSVDLTNTSWKYQAHWAQLPSTATETLEHLSEHLGHGQSQDMMCLRGTVMWQSLCAAKHLWGLGRLMMSSTRAGQNFLPQRTVSWKSTKYLDFWHGSSQWVAHSPRTMLELHLLPSS